MIDNIIKIYKEKITELMGYLFKLKNEFLFINTPI